MLKQLSHIFGSKSKAQEIILLQNDAKEIVRQGFYEHELIAVKRFCKQNNLHCIKSRFKVLLADDNSQNRFSNKGIRISENDPRPGMYFLYFSKDEEKALLAAYFEMMNSHKDLGRVLGYPNCCVEYFCKAFNKGNPNPEHQPTNAWTNLTKREQDQVLLSHFPCNSECIESINLAQKYLETIMIVDRNRAEELLTELKVDKISQKFSNPKSPVQSNSDRTMVRTHDFLKNKRPF